jgi:hypothetical protein
MRALDKLAEIKTNPNLSDEEVVITELDKYMVYNDVLESDEIAVVDKDKDYIYLFREDLPKILEEKILGIKGIKNDPIGLEDLIKISNRDSCEKIILDDDFAANVAVYWAELRYVPRPSTDFFISAYPVGRNVPFAVKNAKSVMEVDLMPIIEGYPKSLKIDELVNRITKQYRNEWENKFGKWSRLEKSQVYVV